MQMFHQILLVFALACSGCVASQPESGRTVAAYDVPLPTAQDRKDFIRILDSEARTAGFHLDAASDENLEQLSISPMTVNAAIWRGDDEELVASAMA